MPELEVISATVEAQEGQNTKIGSPRFTEALLVQFHKRKVWRTLTSLAVALHVDPKQLSDWLDADPCYICRAGKASGVFYYALKERLSEHSSSSEKNKAFLTRRVLREEDSYALGMLHMLYFQLYTVLKTYGLEISQRDMEAFGNFTTAFDKLEAGLLLFSKKTKASMEKLPNFN